MKKLDRTWRSHFLRAIVTWRNSPEAIALGASVGVFVAFTPTVGAQMILAALIATFLRANRPAAIVASWLANPLTVPPLFAFTYFIGTWMLRLPDSGREYQRLVTLVRSMNFHSLTGTWTFLNRLVELGAGLVLILVVGGAFAGLTAAVLAYPVVLWTGRRFRTYRDARKKHRRIRWKDKADKKT
jgi:uncharacterized protein (DUF2062 family)